MTSKKRKIRIRTPGSRLKIVKKPKKVGQAKCGNCGKHLHGIPRLQSSKFKNISKTKKRPQRLYGGILCSKCMRQKIMEKIIN